jgi:hypothetical protein
MTKNKRHRLRIKTISLLVGALMPLGIAAQSSGSPYSMFGLGNFNAKGDVRSYGMGGAGMALASENSLGNLNVASLSGLDSMLFFIDLQTKANYTRYSTSQMSESNTDLNFENISFGFKVAPYWGLTFGISSLSNTDYNIQYSNYILGTLSTYDILFQGKGGLSKIYWGNGWRLAKGLSVGLNLSYVWGSLSTYKTSTFSKLTAKVLKTKPPIILKTLFGMQVYSTNINGTTTRCRLAQPINPKQRYWQTTNNRLLATPLILQTKAILRTTNCPKPLAEGLALTLIKQ